MLANGAKLYYKKTGAEAYAELTGLKEVPELGEEPEKVDNTGLNDPVKISEFGIGDPGELQYKFKYDNSSSTSPYRVMRNAAADKEVLTFKEELPDGTTYEYDAMPSVKLGSGAVNGVLEFTLKMALQSEMGVTDPT